MELYSGFSEEHVFLGRCYFKLPDSPPSLDVV